MDWSKAVLSKDKGYFPESSTNEAHKQTDKLMDARFCIYLEKLLELPHAEFINNNKRVYEFGLHADLPDDIIRMFTIFVRGLFDANGKLRDHWRDFQKDLKRPESGWYELITRIGYVFGNGIAEGRFVAHPESQLANFFKVYYQNHEEYRTYFAALKDKMSGGHMVTILKPVEYFRTKAKGGPLDGSKLKPEEGAGGVDAGMAL